MLKVGLTGGIGTGKSTVGKIFTCLGIPVINSDIVAKQLYTTNIDLQNTITKAFGKEIFINGILQKDILAKIVFSTTENTALLNSIVHPYVIEYINHWTNKQVAPYCIKESALLIESKTYLQQDVVIGVTAPLPLRIQRVQQRDNITLAQIEQRISKQIPEEDKLKMYNYTITNNDVVAILPQVLHLHKLLLEKANG